MGRRTARHRSEEIDRTDANRKVGAPPFLVQSSVSREQRKILGSRRYPPSPTKRPGPSKNCRDRPDPARRTQSYWPKPLVRPTSFQEMNRQTATVARHRRYAAPVANGAIRNYSKPRANRGFKGQRTRFRFETDTPERGDHYRDRQWICPGNRLIPKGKQ